MKKKIALLLLAAMLFSLGGCGKEPADTAQTNQEAIENEFESTEAGLSFTIPDAWSSTENANLIPTSYVNPDGEIYAKILYQYASDENMEALNDITSDIPVEDLMLPLVEFLVVKDENLESDAVNAELALFRGMDILPEKEGYNFYFLTEPVSGYDKLSADAQEAYLKLVDTLPMLLESVTTSVPDEAAVRAAAEEDSKYLNFITTTLDDDAITSATFYDYDCTVVNFWASYCYPDINELAELQKFYTQLQEKHPNVNFLQVIIDTPAEEAEKIVAEAYQEAGVTFTGIMPDQNLATWILDNLEGLPTTVFVDKQGKTQELTIQGVQDAAYYMEQTEAILAKSAE